MPALSYLSSLFSFFPCPILSACPLKLHPLSVSRCVKSISCPLLSISCPLLSVPCPLLSVSCPLLSVSCPLVSVYYTLVTIQYMQEVEQLWAEKREKERRIAQLELELDQAGTDHHYSTQPKTDLFCSLLEERLIQHHLQSPCLLKPLSPKAPVS